MGKENIKQNAQDFIEDLSGTLENVVAQLTDLNKSARKRNRLAKRQLRQDELNYEQLERQYLMEKSNLQPSFKLSVSEFLLSEPDFLSDPEVASEAAYLIDQGFDVEESILRIRVQLIGGGECRRPSLVIARTQSMEPDERVYSMSEGLYFIRLAEINIAKHAPEFISYFVYRDKTTLPVVHKYQVAQLENSTLRRWEVSHLDTIFASSHKGLSALNHSLGCADLFVEREDS